MTVLLTDFSDAGNASADAVPRDFVTLRIAPMSFAFETFTASERMSYLMNHELVHVMTNDRPAPRDQFFRQLFRGKVAPVAEHPESVPYLYLTAPRRAAPRWYMEGIAVFLDTWMAGGLGRAQGPFDEMVFRSMVLDGSRFSDPLGLAAELTKTDFQVEANSYLYGTRFMNYLAYTYTTRVADSLDVTDERLEGVLRVGIQAGLRHADRAGLARLDRVRAGVPAQNIADDSRTSDDAVPGRVARGARFAVARVRRSRAPDDLRRPELPRHCRLHRARSAWTMGASSICRTSSSRGSTR